RTTMPRTFIGLPKMKKEEEEKAFDRNFKSVNDIQINEIPDQTTKKRHLSNTVLKSINNGNYNEQINLASISKEHK
ncbi:766_t:CDS:1, partial [Racocetra persica]